MERMTRSASLDCPMVDRRYVFINFNFENDLSALATVTGIVRNSVNSVIHAVMYVTSALKGFDFRQWKRWGMRIPVNKCRFKNCLWW